MCCTLPYNAAVSLFSSCTGLKLYGTFFSRIQAEFAEGGNFVLAPDSTCCQHCLFKLVPCKKQDGKVSGKPT